MRATGASIIWLAKRDGWRDPRSSSRADSTRRSPGELTFLTPADCASAKGQDYVVKGMITARDVSCLVGSPGVGKSLFAPYLGYMVAIGEPAFQMRTRAGPVLYVAAEDEAGMRKRICALRERHGDSSHFTLVCGVSDLLTKDSADLSALRKKIEELRPVLVIIDTLAMAFPGLEENTADGMGRVVSVARALAVAGAAVILVHHDTKDGSTGLPRGHSLLNGALDMSLHLTRASPKVVRGRLTKNRNGSSDVELAFQVETRILGKDGDGDPITAAFAVEVSREDLPPQTKL